jgi:hypothetical protein
MSDSGRCLLAMVCFKALGFQTYDCMLVVVEFPANFKLVELGDSHNQSNLHMELSNNLR